MIAILTSLPAAVDRAADTEVVPCNLCGASRFSLVHPACPDRLHPGADRFDVVRCTTCGLIQTNPRPTRPAISMFYPEGYVSFAVEGEQAGPRRRLAERLNAIALATHRIRHPGCQRYPPPTSPQRARLLDIGTGAGLHVERMIALGWDAWGIEPDAAIAKETESRLGLARGRILIGSAEDESFPDGPFDLVTMSHVIEHLHDPHAVLARVREVLAPGGRVMLWLPNIGSLESRAFGRLWFGLDVPRHLYHFSPATLRALLATADLKVVSVVSEAQTASLSGSIRHCLAAGRVAPAPYRHSRALYYVTLPAAMMSLLIGAAPTMQVVAIAA